MHPLPKKGKGAKYAGCNQTNRSDDTQTLFV